jgi:hypothetical protein
MGFCSTRCQCLSSARVYLRLLLASSDLWAVAMSVMAGNRLAIDKSQPLEL